MTGLTVSAAARITARPVGTLPISATLAMSAMRGERLADFPAARHDVEDAGRQHAVEQLGKTQ